MLETLSSSNPHHYHHHHHHHNHHYHHHLHHHRLHYHYHRCYHHFSIIIIITIIIIIINIIDYIILPQWWCAYLGGEARLRWLVTWIAVTSSLYSRALLFVFTIATWWGPPSLIFISHHQDWNYIFQITSEHTQCWYDTIQTVKLIRVQCTYLIIWWFMVTCMRVYLECLVVPAFYNHTTCKCVTDYSK